MSTELRRKLLDIGMSNFDQSIDDGLEDALRADPSCVAFYAGWGFAAYVHVEADDDHYTCEVWVHKSLVKTIRCETLQEVMKQVRSEFGED